MNKPLIAALLAFAAPVMAQVPAGATPITLTQVDTVGGVTTWTGTIGGQPIWIQAATYLVLEIPGAETVTPPVPAPGLWTTAAATPPPPTTPTPSPDLTAIANNDGKAIYDILLNKWQVVNNQVLENGKAAGYTSGVVKLVTVKGVIWQENSAAGWWYWNVLATTWDGGAAPI